MLFHSVLQKVYLKMNPLRMTFSLLLVVTAIATRHRYCESVSSARNPDRCYQNDELYHIYVMLEAALKNNSEILYMMKQVFYPVLGPHYWLANGVYIVWIDVCTTIRVVKSCPKKCKWTSIQQHSCEWTISWLLAISLDQFTFIKSDPSWSAACIWACVGKCSLLTNCRRHFWKRSRHPTLHW